MKIEKKHWAGIAMAFLLIVISFIFLQFDALFYFIAVIALVIGALPFIVTIVVGRGRQREKEEKFLEFTRDLVENVKSGIPISKGILNIQKRDYGPLSPHVKKLANQISLGITLRDALFTFARESKSKVISRAVGLISEAERAGGDIGSILESVSRSVNQVEDLKKERKAAVSNLVVQGYIIFMVFIIIMIVLEFKVLPLTSGLGEVDSLSIKVKPIDAAQFAMPMLLMLITQSFFAGLVIGKISEGTIMSGIKHSFILLALTLLIKTGANILFGG
jgi:archaeal flagellar protein FlaJ